MLYDIHKVKLCLIVFYLL